MRALLTSCALWLAACGHAEVAAPPAPAAITLALVYPAQEIWIGNDHDPQVAADDPARFPGALDAVEAAIDRAELARRAPPGSQAVVLTFGRVVTTRLRRGDLAQLRGAALGRQADYHGELGAEIVAGVTAALDELERAPAGPKRLIVLSDGNATDNARARPALAALGQRAARLGVTVTSLIYRSALAEPGDVVSALAPSQTVASADELTRALTAALERAVAER